MQPYSIVIAGSALVTDRNEIITFNVVDEITMFGNFFISLPFVFKVSDAGFCSSLISNVIGNLPVLSVGVDYLECKNLLEGLAIVNKSIDRITPIPKSIFENEKYFWELASYYKGFFNRNNDITSLIFDNVPHLPWDLTLFYVAKLMNI